MFTRVHTYIHAVLHITHITRGSSVRSMSNSPLVRQHLSGQSVQVDHHLPVAGRRSFSHKGMRICTAWLTTVCDFRVSLVPCAYVYTVRMQIGIPPIQNTQSETSNATNDCRLKKPLPVQGIKITRIYPQVASLLQVR